MILDTLDTRTDPVKGAARLRFPRLRGAAVAGTEFQYLKFANLPVPPRSYPVVTGSASLPFLPEGKGELNSDTACIQDLIGFTPADLMVRTKGGTIRDNWILQVANYARLSCRKLLLERSPPRWFSSSRSSTSPVGGAD